MTRAGGQTRRRGRSRVRCVTCKAEGNLSRGWGPGGLGSQSWGSWAGSIETWAGAGPRPFGTCSTLLRPGSDAGCSRPWKPVARCRWCARAAASCSGGLRACPSREAHLARWQIWVMTTARDTDGIWSSTTSTWCSHRLRFTALTELLTKGLHGLQQGLVHVLSHHGVIHLHPKLSGASNSWAPHLNEEKILWMTTSSDIHQLQHYRGHIRVELDKVDCLVS